MEKCMHHMPIAISVQHLREVTSQRLQQKFPDDTVVIPSEEWMRLRFWPHNPFSTSSLRHTERFSVKYCVQACQLRKHHPGSWYVSVILKYVKALALRYREHPQMILLTINNIVPMGEPGAPILTSVCPRNWSLSLTVSGLTALDHNFHIQGLYL